MLCRYEGLSQDLDHLGHNSEAKLHKGFFISIK